jgi:monomeric sarcosine oxidase
LASFDTIIVGLGTVGAATVMTLAQRGVSVLGLDAHRPPHTMGSHHGESRSIRRAYLEGTAYVPMVQRAWHLWRRLERDAGVRLLTETGNLTLAPEDAPALKGFLASARRYDIPHAVLSAAEVHRRWPSLAPAATLVGGLEFEAGLIAPERALAAMLAAAARGGAVLQFDERVATWEVAPGGVRVRSSRGVYEGGRLLISAGAGTQPLLGSLASWLRPKRVPVHWVAAPDDQGFALGRLPVNFWQLPLPEDSGGEPYHEIYAIPVTRPGGRVKVAAHNRLMDCDPLRVDRSVGGQETADIRRFLKDHIPSLANGDIRSEVCLYTLTPDGDFVLGPLAEIPQVFTAALAGHGFKFAPVLGNIMADLLQGRPPAYDLTRFAPLRFAQATT